MMVLAWPAVPGRLPGVALLFGTGLIGAAVAKALSRATGAVTQPLLWRWEDNGAKDAQAMVRVAVAALTERPGAGLTVIWAAGRSGFGSDSEVMEREAAALDAVLASGRHILDAVPDRRGALHHVSSAGGLFEGQVACGPDAVPRPLRPYGLAKLAQERTVIDHKDFAIRRIYRPSSVYGHATGGRVGLIPALMTAAFTRLPARVLGALSTQRDYIHADDIGRHVAQRVLDPGTAPLVTSLLAQARPASIFEILRLVEAQIGLPILQELDPRPDNARDTTFLRTALPPGFRPVPLVEGITRTALTMYRDHMGIVPC